MVTVSQPDPSLYPKVYSASPLYKLISMLLYAGYFALLVWLYRYCWNAKMQPVVWSACVTFILAAAWSAIEPICRVFSKTILYKDRIVYKTWFSKREMRRDHVAGQKSIYRWHSGSDSVLIYKHVDGLFLLSDGIHKDELWNAWMTGIPDLDA